MIDVTGNIYVSRIEKMTSKDFIRCTVIDDIGEVPEVDLNYWLYDRSQRKLGTYKYLGKSFDGRAIFEEVRRIADFTGKGVTLPSPVNEWHIVAGVRRGLVNEVDKRILLML